MKIPREWTRRGDADIIRDLENRPSETYAQQHTTNQDDCGFIHRSLIYLAVCAITQMDYLTPVDLP